MPLRVRVVWWSATIVFVSALFLIKNKTIFSETPQVIAQKILDGTDIKLNGTQECDPRIHNPELYNRVLRDGSLGLGEAYVQGWWDCPKLDDFFHKLLKADVTNKINITLPWIYAYLKAQFSNLQSKDRAFEVGERHYDLGNDLFQAMLDKRMIYSCAYWKNAKNLDEAQEHKLDLICKKLHLKPGMTVLDIGCGWGGLAQFMAQNYKAHVVGLTISKEQAELAREFCKGLPVEIRLQDYRDLNQKFDRIVSVGMFEHVGSKNYKTFMEIAHKCLNDNGLFLLHTIGNNVATSVPDPWIEKYIFPNGLIPSLSQISNAYENLFVLEDLHNFGADYDKTLMAWFHNFNAHWPELKKTYGEPFYRMWTYYLLSCAGLFRARAAQLWQFVFSKNGIPNGYISVR